MSERKDEQAPGRDPEQMILKMILGQLEACAIGAALQYGPLSIFPLSAPNGHEPAYMLLEDALEMSTASISEASQGGSVPELLIENRGDKPILVLEGDVLIGAKQNRVVNITVLVGAHTRLALPVSCVERGRWRYVSEHFSVKRSAHPGLRAAKLASVQRSKRMVGRPVSDQLEVWDKVDECLASLSAASPTDSLEDGFAQSERRLAEYGDRMRLPEGAAGFLVACRGKVVGLDLFDCPRTAARCWGRLSESYFMEALRGEVEGEPEKVKPKAVDRRHVRGFLGRLSRGLRLSQTTTGLGREIEVEGAQVAGAGVWFEGRVLHLAAFALEQSQAKGHQDVYPDQPIY